MFGHKTPANRTKSNASWVCETLDSRVFTSSAKPSNFQKRGWLGANAAGTPREKVATPANASITFYNPGMTRAQYPGQRELMGEILYGKEQLESQRRVERPSTFAHAAGHQQSFADRPESQPPDRHPDLQRAISVDAAWTQDNIEHHPRGLTGDAAVSAEEGDNAVAATDPEGYAAARALLKHAPPTRADELIYHPQWAKPSDLAPSPRKAKGPARKGAIREHVFPGHQRTTAFGDPLVPPSRSKADEADQFTIPAAGDLYAKDPDRPQRKSLKHPGGEHVGALIGGDETVDISDGPTGGVMRVHVEPQPTKPQGRAAGYYNPGTTDGPAGGFSPAAATSAWTPAPSFAGGVPQKAGGKAGDAGVLSSRLHELQAGTQQYHSSGYAAPSAATRQRMGTLEGRAGVGTALPDEQRVCGLSRRAPNPHINPQVTPRDPMRGESRTNEVGSSVAPARGRVHLAPSAAAAQDHLAWTLVPDGDKATGGRPTGKATGERAKKCFEENFGGQEAAAVIAPGVAPPLEAAGDPSLHTGPYGKRHIEAGDHHLEWLPAHAPVPAPAFTKMPGVTAGSTPSLVMRGSMSMSSLAPAATSGRRMMESYSSRQVATGREDAKAAYNQLRARGSSSSVFADLNYPTGGGGEY